MKKALAVLAIAVVAAFGAASPAPAQPVAHVSCSYHQTPGGRKCLAAGEYCSHKPGYAAAYRNAGYRCNREGRLVHR